MTGSHEAALESRGAWNTKVVLSSTQEIKPWQKVGSGGEELWAELTHSSKYRPERQTWRGRVERLCRSVHGSRRVQESQSLAGFKSGKQAKAKKNVDPLLKEVWDLVTTASSRDCGVQVCYDRKEALILRKDEKENPRR